MKTPEHTPGPWRIQEVQEWLNANPVAWTSVAMTSNFVILPTQCAPMLGRNDEANARLMAASPEMLKTLKQLLEVAEHAVNEGGKFVYGDLLEIESRMNAAKQVIASATGENA